MKRAERQKGGKAESNEKGRKAEGQKAKFNIRDYKLTIFSHY